MKIRILNIGVVILLVSFKNFPQLSIYNSASYGYFQNPLYNYQYLPDQLKQTYTELSYSKSFQASKLNLHYIGGLVIFNRFVERNYYEHNFATNYNIFFSKDNPDQESEEKTIENSADNHLNLSIKIGGRHDKEAFKEFNNYGSGLTASFTFMLNDDLYSTIANAFEYRDYSNITTLSNITEVLKLQIGNKENKTFNYGLGLSGGFKYYIESVYDTSRFETVRSYAVKSSGKGKTGANITVPSDKKILISPQSNGTVQFVADVFAKTYWNTNSIQLSLLYRYNPNTLVRYLAQYANTTFLTEDIYNDFFAYEGFEISSRLIQKIFYDIEIRLDASFQQKKFGAPALELIGTQIADQRLDYRNFIEAYISRYFNLSDNFGLGLAISTGFVRNQSNDAYNDFSAHYISFSLGLGYYTEF